MKFLVPAIVASVALGSSLSAKAQDGLCAPLRAFVASVKASQTRQLEFHTSWGTNFKDDRTLALEAKRCIHHGYAPAKTVCTYLMKHAQVEFSGNNVKRALICLSPHTKFAPLVQVDLADFSFSYGSEQRGANITLVYDGDDKIGGMVLTIKADGY